MKYYISELITENKVMKTAGIKARDDANAIVESLGWKPLIVENNKEENEKRKQAGLSGKLKFHKVIRDRWISATKELKAGDELFIQFPAISHSLLLYQAIAKIQKRGVRVVLLIHDLELFRAALRKDHNPSLGKKIRITLEEKTILKSVDGVIVHNSKMKEIVKGFGVDEAKLIDLGIFDYLIPAADDEKMQKLSDEAYHLDAPVVIAGNLRKHKAGYAYKLPETPAYNLYGVDYEHTQKNVTYFGAFPPDDLPFVMKGSFGLVWDGEQSGTCSGVYGEYLKMNNPHKTSLYLAAGMPVVIWKQAALADFVSKNKCGILVESLYDLEKEISSVTPEEYEEMKKNALHISKELRTGMNTCRALENFSSL